jgi:hypothetical protein
MRAVVLSQQFPFKVLQNQDTTVNAMQKVQLITHSYVLIKVEWIYEHMMSK